MFALESPAVWLGHGYLQLVAAASSGLAEGTAEGTVGGEVLAQVGEPDETRQAITFLIVCLIGIALLLAVLTVWYWQFTSPKRRASSLLSDLGHYESDPSAAMATPASPPVLAAAGGPSPAPDHIRIPAPAPAPAIDDRKRQAPAFSSAVSASAVSANEAPPLAPPELPTNATRRAAASKPEPPHWLPKPTPETPRRIEVAARASANGPRKADSRVAEGYEPIFADRATGAVPDSSTDPTPSPVETKTGTAASGTRLADTATPGSAKTSTSTSTATSAAATITHRGPVLAPKPAVPAPASSTRRTAAKEQPVAASAAPTARRQAEKAPVAAKAKQPPRTADGQEGLSDDDWAAVMQSAFSKLNK